MATENKVLDLSFEAGEDLTNDQYRIVVLDPTAVTVRRPDAATDMPLGVLQNAPDDGEAAVVRPVGCGGVSKLVLGATLAVGAHVSMEYNSASDAGKAVDCASASYPVGILLEGGDEDDLVTCLLTPITVHV